MTKIRKLGSESTSYLPIPDYPGTHHGRDPKGLTTSEQKLQWGWPARSYLNSTFAVATASLSRHCYYSCSIIIASLGDKRSAARHPVVTTRRRDLVERCP